MAKIPSYVATKNDVLASERRVKKHFHDSLKHFTGVIESFHDQQRGWKKRMKDEFSTLMNIISENNRKALIHEMRVLVEDIRHEYLGATNDRLSLHDDSLNAQQERLVVLEEKVGVL